MCCYHFLGKKLGTLECCCFLAPLGKNLVSEDAASLITRFYIEEQTHFLQTSTTDEDSKPMQLLWFDCGIYIIRMSCWPVGPRQNISHEASYVSISYYFLDFEALKILFPDQLSGKDLRSSGAKAIRTPRISTWRPGRNSSSACRA